MSKYTTIRITTETREKLREISNSQDMSMCELLKQLVNQLYVKENDNKLLTM